MKHISSNFKQGIKIGMLMALTISMAMTTGCEMPNGTTGGNENPGNSGNENPGNSGNGGNNGNTDNEQDSKYGVPYDKAIGNGNYILHNFVSDNDNINKKETAVEDVNHYLGLGETYVKGKANELGTSTSGRTTYFNDFVNAIQNNDSYLIDDFNVGRNNLDRAAENISMASEPILVDIIKNLNNKNDQNALYYSYRILANEAYKEGLGSYRHYSGSLMDVYENEKATIDFEGSYVPALKEMGLQTGKVYDDNFLTQITQLTDSLLVDAAKNMGQNIEVTDLQKVVNLALTPHSMSAMDGLTRGLLDHTTCPMILDEISAMDRAIGTFKTLNQDQGLSL